MLNPLTNWVCTWPRTLPHGGGPQGGGDLPWKGVETDRDEGD